MKKCSHLFTTKFWFHDTLLRTIIISANLSSSLVLSHSFNSVMELLKVFAKVLSKYHHKNSPNLSCKLRNKMHQYKSRSKRIFAILTELQYAVNQKITTFHFNSLENEFWRRANNTSLHHSLNYRITRISPLNTNLKSRLAQLNETNCLTDRSRDFPTNRIRDVVYSLCRPWSYYSQKKLPTVLAVFARFIRAMHHPLVRNWPPK